MWFYQVCVTLLHPQRFSRVHCTTWTQKAILDGQGLSLSPILTNPKIMEWLMRKQLLDAHPIEAKEEALLCSMTKDECISCSNSNHFKGLTDWENTNTCCIHQRDISQIYPKRENFHYLFELASREPYSPVGGSLGWCVPVLQQVIHPLLLLSTCCSWELMFVRKTAKIDFWQQENRAQYVATRTMYWCLLLGTT